MLGVRASLRLLRRRRALAARADASGRRGGAARRRPATSCCAAIEQRADQAQRVLQSCEETRDGRRRRARHLRRRPVVRFAKARGLAIAGRRMSGVEGRALLRGGVVRAASCSTAASPTSARAFPGPEQAKLRQFLDGWENASKALGQLAEFGVRRERRSAGPRRIDRRSNGSSRACWARSASPFFYRRLLTEAVRLTAPRAWQRLRAVGRRRSRRGSPRRIRSTRSSSRRRSG